MTNKDRDDNTVESILDMAETVMDFAREHEDVLQSIGGDSGGTKLNVQEPLAEAHIKDDEVVIVAEAEDEDVDEMSVKFEEGTFVFNLGGTVYEAEVPPDVVEDSVNASLNNGVLRVTLDRMNTDDFKSVQVENEGVDEKQDIDDIIGDGEDDSEIDVEDNTDSLFEDGFDGGDEDGPDE